MGEKKERLEGGGRTTQKDQDMDLTVGKDPAHGDSRGQAWHYQTLAGRTGSPHFLQGVWAWLGAGRSLPLPQRAEGTEIGRRTRLTSEGMPGGGHKTRSSLA